MEGEQKKLGFECEDYAAFIKCEGKWVEVEKVRNEMKEKRIKTRHGTVVLFRYLVKCQNHTKLILVVCKFNS